MTVEQHHRPSTPPTRPPLDSAPAPFPAVPGPAPRMRRFHYEPDVHTSGQDGRSELASKPITTEPITTEVPDDPTAHAAAHRVLLLVMQVLNRRRPITHLAEVTAPAVARYVRAINPVPGLVHVTSLHVRLPRPDAAEVVAVCRFGTRRYRVIAARLDRRPAVGWQCTALRLL